MRPFLPISFLALLGLAAWREPAGKTVELELTYLANEGFLVGSGEEKLLVDAFVTEPYAGYAAVPKELFADMLAGAAPFEGVTLALASHHHRDHFQAEAAAEYLQAQPETGFLSSPQVVDDLLVQLGEHAVAETLQVFLPEGEESIEARAGPIRIELLRIPHSGGARTAHIQNLGHLIEIGGARLLHVGDAELGADELASARLAEREIDVALVPYWWLGDAAGLARTRGRTGATHLVAVHVPPGEVTEVGEHLAQLDPAILLFREAGEAKTLSIE